MRSRRLQVRVLAGGRLGLAARGRETPDGRMARCVDLLFPAPIVHDSHPRTILRHPIPPDPSPMPMFNIDAPDIRARALRVRPTFDPT